MIPKTEHTTVKILYFTMNYTNFSACRRIFSLPNQCLLKNFLTVKIYSKNIPPFSISTDCYPVQGASKAPKGITNHIIAGIMAFVMGIVTMVRLTKNMPKEVAEAAVYNSSVYYDNTVIKGHQLLSPAISTTDYMTMIKRMAELEEKVNVLSNKPAVMPAEKEAMLNAALSRVDALEQELSSTKKVLP